MRLERKKNSFALCSLHFSILTSSVVLFCRFLARVCFLPLSCFLDIVSFYLHLIFQRFQCKYFNFNGFDLCSGCFTLSLSASLHMNHLFIYSFFPLLYVVVHLLFQQQKSFDIRRRRFPYKYKYKSAYNTYVQIHWKSEKTKNKAKCVLPANKTKYSRELSVRTYVVTRLLAIGLYTRKKNM